MWLYEVTILTINNETVNFRSKLNKKKKEKNYEEKKIVEKNTKKRFLH